MCMNKCLIIISFILICSCSKDDIDNHVAQKKTDDAVSFWNCDFGAEINIFPNEPTNSSNPFYIGSSYRHKQFGAGCVGKNNVIYFVTRVAGGHGVSGGNLYWSKSEDEGDSWSPLMIFSQDQVGDASAEDLRDCTLYYDDLLEKYFLIYVHQYGIVNHDYSNITGQLKVFMGDTPFEKEMIDISPGKVPLDDNEDLPSIQSFETFHRVGNKLFLPCYKWKKSKEYYTSILEFVFNDSMPTTYGVQFMKWKTIKDWDNIGDSEMTMYLTSLPNGAHRINTISRRSGVDDMGYLSFSDDGGVTWTEKESIGFQVAGGPRVFDINGKYMLVAREQTIPSQSNIYALFSVDGKNWGNRIIIGNTGSGYPSIVTCKSGKILLFYGKEYSHTGVETYREVYLKR